MNVRRAIGSTFLAHVVQTASSIVTVKWFLRAFGDDVFGYWSALLGLTSYLSLLNFGISQAVSSHSSLAAPGDETAVPRAVQRGLRAYAKLCAVAIPLVAFTGVLAPWSRWFGLPSGMDGPARAAAVAVGVTFVLELPASMFRAALAGAGEVATERAFAVASILARMAAAWVFSLLHPSLWSAVVVLSAVSLASYGACALALRRRFPKLFVPVPARDDDAVAAREFRAAGWSFFVLQIAGAVMWATDPFLAGVAVDALAAGRVSVTWRVMSVVLSISGLVPSALAPGLAQKWASGDRVETARLATQATVVLCGITVVFALGLASAGHDLIRLWLGEAMYPGHTAWLAYCVILVVQAPLGVPHAFVTQAGLHRRYAVLALVEGLVKLGLGLALMRFFGLAGLPLATLLARASTVLWFLPAVFTEALEVRPVPWLWGVARTLGPATLAYGLVWGATLAIWPARGPLANIVCAMSAGLAFVAAFVLRGLDADTRGRLFAVAGSRLGRK